VPQTEGTFEQLNAAVAGHLETSMPRQKTIAISTALLQVLFKHLFAGQKPGRQALSKSDSMIHHAATLRREVYEAKAILGMLRMVALRVSSFSIVMSIRSSGKRLLTVRIVHIRGALEYGSLDLDSIPTRPFTVCIIVPALVSANAFPMYPRWTATVRLVGCSGMLQHKEKTTHNLNTLIVCKCT
jgi:hypothetical protein